MKESTYSGLTEVGGVASQGGVGGWTTTEAWVRKSSSILETDANLPEAYFRESITDG